MIDQGSVPSLMGSTVRDGAGDKIGKVGQVYLDDTTGQPEWVTVRTGLFGARESFVPLAAARVEGDELVVDVTKDQVTSAPKIDEDGHLSEEQEAELYSYYGVSRGAFGQDTGPLGGYPTADTGTGPGTYPTTGTGPGTDASYAQTGTIGYEDTAVTTPGGIADHPAGPVADDATARSEEPSPAGTLRGRLRRYVGTEPAEVDDDSGTRRDR